MEGNMAEEAATPEQVWPKRRGRKPKGERAMTPAERSKASRFNRTYTQEGYSGKQVNVMLSGPAHMALDDLVVFFGDKTQKEVIEMGLFALTKVRDLQKSLL
jgi:hypothetical protein